MEGPEIAQANRPGVQTAGAGQSSHLTPHTARKHQEGLQRQMARGFLAGWNERNEGSRAGAEACRAGQACETAGTRWRPARIPSRACRNPRQAD